MPTCPGQPAAFRRSTGVERTRLRGSRGWHPAAIYRNMVFGVPLAYLPGRLAAWATEAGRQLGGGAWGALIALLGLWRLERT